jgi:hypothetical protein
MRSVFLLIVSIFSAVAACAQDDLFGPQASGTVRSGFLIGANGSADFPAADMAKRFGTSFRVGGSLQYRLQNNWQFGVKGDFLFGNDIREDSSLINVRDASGFFLDDAGQRTGAAVSERGYLLGIMAGKMIPFHKADPNKGLLLQLTTGFMQHKISFYNQQENLAQLHGDYKKGYDRLTNGWFVEPYVGYQHFSNSGLVNFHIGLDAVVGFNAGRRDYQFDIRRPDKDSRLDVLFGIRGGWYFTIYKKKSEEVFFE